MCRLQYRRPTGSGQGNAPRCDDDRDKPSTSFFRRTASSARRKLPTLILLASLPLLPTSSYLNRGYTVWFHLLSTSYIFTRSSFVRRVLILMGAGICLGWYAAILRDWFVEGTFCHTLYRNMPGFMLEYMVVDNSDGTYVLLNTHSSYAAKAASHVLDLLAHPGLTYLFWRLHRRSGGTLRDVLSWPVLAFAWHLSRTWSVVHSVHNHVAPAFWYYGHDVYLMNDLDGYFVAYVAEGACFAAAIACRLHWDRCEDRSSSTGEEKMIEERRLNSCGSIWGEKEDSKPALIHSESAVSTNSLSS